ncbi:hypothetical protein R3W88_014966 [Solanum pinnatisectum]|uniref:Uncharacterized protein n=1 Tax=Solanum pinnatisectum TaxID=50273 RepID=A0AAV9KTX2_9SOLN|nr:hypothetical protein R3W88_014966 [Solanum pinnatisectum]
MVFLLYNFLLMPQLHTSLHFHLTPIVMINGSSRRDLLLNSQKNFCRSIPARAENPSLSRLCYRKLWGRFIKIQKFIRPFRLTLTHCYIYYFGSVCRWRVANLSIALVMFF